MNASPLVYVGIRGSVLALEKVSGSRAWETKLKGGAFVTILVDGPRIFAGTQGEIFCLDAANGKVLWHDGLKGYGFGLLSLATEHGSAPPAELVGEDESRRRSSSGDGGSASASS
jgi:hypothetical protein